MRRRRGAPKPARRPRRARGCSERGFSSARCEWIVTAGGKPDKTVLYKPILKPKDHRLLYLINDIHRAPKAATGGRPEGDKVHLCSWRRARDGTRAARRRRGEGENGPGEGVQLHPPPNPPKHHTPQRVLVRGGRQRRGAPQTQCWSGVLRDVR